MRDPQQDIWYGILITEDDEEFTALWQKYDEDVDTLDVAINEFCKKVGLRYHMIGYEEEEGVVIGHSIASWGEFEIKEVDLSDLVVKETEARSQLTPAIVAAVQEFLGTSQEPKTWSISYVF
jgi:hypothetical protein